MLAKNVNFVIICGMRRNMLDKLKVWKDKNDRKPLILRGVRQAGKTYILQSFAETCFSAVHYLNFEKDEKLKTVFENDLSPQRIIQELSFYLNRPIDVDHDIVIFDEIQNIPRALTSLKYFCEEMPNLAVCAAGSLLGIHLGEASFPVGKVEFLDMFPMSFLEFLEGIGDIKSVDFIKTCKSSDKIPEVIHSHLFEQLKRYFVVGGLPEVVKVYAEFGDNLFLAVEKARKKQEDLISAYHADMAKHCGKENAMHIDRLWKNVPTQLAREQNGSASKFRFKGVIPQVNRFSRLSGVIDWLDAAGLIIKTHIVNNGELPFLAHVVENSFKLYLFDVGILGALSGLPAKTILDYDYGSYKGYFAENYIAQEFLCSGVRDLFCWREKNSEIEFLREDNGVVIPVEIKSGWVTKSKSLKFFAEKYKPAYRVIFSAKPLSIDNKSGLHQYPLYMVGRFPL